MDLLDLNLEIRIWTAALQSEVKRINSDATQTIRLGLYARSLKEPEAFRSDYDAFLSSTGIADAKTLATRFGMDIQSVDFWRSSLDVIRNQIAEFERLLSSQSGYISLSCLLSVSTMG